MFYDCLTTSGWLWAHGQIANIDPAMTSLFTARERIASLGVAAAAAAVVACSDAGPSTYVSSPPPATPTTPWSLVKFTPGDDLQTDTVLAGRAPLRVVVRTNGSPVSGVTVAWTMSGAETGTDSATTDSNGVASKNFAFGTKAGAYVVQAVVPQHPELAAVSFVGNALAGHATTIRIVSGSGQTDSVAAQLHDDFVVRATDGHDNPAPGVAVDWAVAAGGGSLSKTQTTTVDSDGSSAVRYTLGRAIGADTVIATLHGIDAKATFQAIATAANPAKLTIVSGNNQSGQVNHVLGADFVVKVTDALDNPVSGIGVDWSIMSGGGTLSATHVTSGIDGLGSTRSTLGPTAGVQSVNASLGSWQGVSAMTFTSTAHSGTLVLVSGGGQAGLTGATLPSPIVVKAIDALGNGIPNQTITFAVPSGFGNAAPSVATTDSQGLAQTVWTIGTVAGVETIVATAGFTATVVAINAMAILPPLALVGDPFDAPIGLGPSLGVDQFTDAAVEPASLTPVSAPVTVTLTHGAHTSLPASVTIAAGTTFGRFRITGTSIGIDTIVASAPGFTSATFIENVGLGIILQFFGSQVAAGSKITADFCIAAPAGNETFVASKAAFSLAMSPNIATYDPIGDPNTPVTSIAFGLPGANCLDLVVKGISAGPATLTITSPNYKPFTVGILVTP